MIDIQTATDVISQSCPDVPIDIEARQEQSPIGTGTGIMYVMIHIQVYFSDATCHPYYELLDFFNIQNKFLTVPS